MHDLEVETVAGGFRGVARAIHAFVVHDDDTHRAGIALRGERAQAGANMLGFVPGGNDDGERGPDAWFGGDPCVIALAPVPETAACEQ